MAGWFGAKRAKLTDQVCLIGISMRERKISPRDGWAHGRLLPRTRKSRKAFQALRSDPYCPEKSTLQVTRRYLQSACEGDDGERVSGHEEPIDGFDDEPIGRGRLTELFHEHGLKLGVRAVGIQMRRSAKDASKPLVKPLGDAAEGHEGVPEGR
jgi:hypothetical protein